MIRTWLAYYKTASTIERRIIVIMLCIGAAVILVMLASLGSDSDDRDELERQALAAEGKSLTADMEQANRDHASASQIREIRERDATFKRRADDYLARHGRTPPP